MAGSKNPNEASIAVIGAGMAGLTCARVLKSSGLNVVIFEKSRGLGGRLATRRTAGGLAFDHGAQYVTAHEDGFRDLLNQASNTGNAAIWKPRGVEAGAGWFVGTPSMNALVKPGVEALDIHRGMTVTALECHPKVWRLTLDRGEVSIDFDYVVSTLPAPQVRNLLAHEPEVLEALAPVEMAPCWSLMVAFGSPLPFSREVRRKESADLAWLARNDTKPGRRPDVDCWVVHASPEWSLQHLEEAPQRVAGKMLGLMRQELGFEQLPETIYSAAHRWRYARTTTPLGQPFFCLPDRGLFLGGDWCLGARVECAFESGRAIASHLGRVAAGETRPQHDAPQC